MTSDEINALPERVRKYIHDLETRCDPAGDVAKLALQRDSIAGLERRILELIAERDEAWAERDGAYKHATSAMQATFDRMQDDINAARAETQRLRNHKARLRRALKNLTDACVPAGNMVSWPSYSEARAAFKETE